MELGLKLALGDAYRCVGYCERDTFAASVLVARMEDEAMDRAPVWDDLSTLPGGLYRGRVDLVSAGAPCQPYSVAGDRRGNSDERALWPEIVRIVRECEPGAVFIENVPPFLKHAEPVWRELRGLGFKWAPPLHATAAHFGAPHNRHRVFLLAAHPERADLWDEPWRSGRTSRAGSREPGDDHHRPADPDGEGLRAERCGWVFDRERQTLRHHPDGCDLRCRVRGSPWEGESPPARVDDGAASWMDETRASGNAVVPLVAANAFLALAARLRRT